MGTRPVLLQQVRDRLLQQKRLNTLGFFIPLAISSWVLGLLVIDILSLPHLLSLLPPLICCGFLGAALWKAQTAVDFETVAALVDDKVGGKDRFLTLVSAPQEETEDVFYSVVQRQTEELADFLRPERDLPFSFDRQILFSVCGALFSLLLLLLLSHSERAYLPFSPLFLDSPALQSQREIPNEAIEALEKAAHQLLQKTPTPQEQMIGAQLSSLAQQLRDPSLSLQEKQQLLEEARKRLNLDLPFPQILPFDLESKSRDGEGAEGNDKGPSQKGNALSANTEDQEGQSQKSTSSSGAGNESQQGAKPDGEKNKQSQPRQEGGGITFNFPQDQKNNQKRSSDEASGVGQQPSQDQMGEGPFPGTDPTRLGGGKNDQAQNQQAQKGDIQSNGEEQNEQGKGEVTTGKGRGKRFLKPGDQPGGGFLTQDAQFVKIRVPIGQDVQATEGRRTINNGRAAPKTPYSNAPLKDSAPEQAQGKQPIPLEYRAILKD